MPSAYTPSAPLTQPKVAARGTKVCLGPGVRCLFAQHLSVRCVLLVILTVILALYALPSAPRIQAAPQRDRPRPKLQTRKPSSASRLYALVDFRAVQQHRAGAPWLLGEI